MAAKAKIPAGQRETERLRQKISLEVVEAGEFQRLTRNKVDETEMRIRRIEEKIGGVPDTQLSRVLPANGRVEWALKIGRFFQPGKTFSARTIDACLRMAEKALRIKEN